jgi:prepilin-type N-terminal cleavage/methylation domain-containing protein
MKTTQKRNRGFTLIELLVVISIIAMLAAGAFGAFGKIMPGIRAKTTASTGKGIWTMLNAWSQDNDQQYPAAEQNSNDAFRELFIKKLVDREQDFAIPNDPWHKNSPDGKGKGPDGAIGTAPDFTQALMPGECAWAYVSGHDGSSNSNLPMLANAFSESPGVYTKDKTKKGGVFSGDKAAWVTAGGSASATDLSSDYKIMQKFGSKDADVFGPDFGTNVDYVKNPAG